MNDDTELLVGDICRTPSCRREPKNGALYCNPCFDQVEQDEYEARLGDAIDLAYEQTREGER